MKEITAGDAQPGMRVGVTTPAYNGIGEIAPRITWHVVGRWVPDEDGAARLLDNEGRHVGIFRKTDRLLIG